MVFISQIVGKPVSDAAGAIIAPVADLAARQEDKSLRISGILLRGDQLRVGIIPVEAVGEISPTGITLSVSRASLTTRPLQPDEVLLVEELLDKQVVDIDGLKVVKVNDLKLDRSNGTWQLVAVDVGVRGLLRRLGLEAPVATLLERLGRPLREWLIPWQMVAALSGPPTALKLRVSRENLRKIHPADLAEIVEDLGREAQLEVMANLDDAVAADVLEETEPEVRTSILKSLSPERAADILEEMAPDEAADLIATLPEETAANLIAQMDQEKAATVRKLLQYPEDTAAGKMTPEYIALPEWFTAEDTIRYLREHAPPAEYLYYLYVTDAEGRLVGVLSLRTLITANPETPLRNLMDTEVIYLRDTDSADAAAGALAKYDLLAIPVVDTEGKLLGIVTIDDVMEILLEKYLPRLPARFHRIRRR